MEHEDNHGHSTAAWIGVAIMLVAATVACWGVVFGPPALLWIGVAVFLVGAVAWYILDKAGVGTQKDDDPDHLGRPITPRASTRGGHRA